MRTSRLTQVLAIFGSGCLVYIGVAACSAIGASSGSSGDGASSGGGGEGGSSGSPVPNANADEWYASGSRLKVRYLEGDDGSKQFVNWLDSTRGDECSFVRYSDGAMRCAPVVGAAVASGYFETGCTKSVGTIAKGSPTPKHVTQYDTAAKATSFTVKGVYPNAVYLGGGGNPCSAIPPTSGIFDLYDFYSLGDEIPASALVLATPKTAP